PGRAHAGGVDVRLLLEVLDAGDEVLVALAAPIAGDLVGVLLAEAGRAARVRQGDDVPLGRPQFRAPAVAPAVLPGALRPAVDEIRDRPFLRRVEAGRLEDPHLHTMAAGARDGDAFGPGHVE